MELEKVSNVAKSATKRWYDDACGAALAMEFVGERWSLLILRELMFGPRRFGEIKAHLAGVSANVLTQRLVSLEEGGLLRRRMLPSPASVPVYELTEWGIEIEPVFQALGRWALRSPTHDPMLPLSPASVMLSFRTMIDPARIGDWRASVGFRLGGDRFVARVEDRELPIVRDEPDGADVLVECDTTALVMMVYGKWPLADAQAAGRVTVSGDGAVFERFVTLFALPPKLAPLPRGKGD